MSIETRIKDLLLNHRKSYASLVTMYFLLFAVISFTVISIVWIISDFISLKKEMKRFKSEYVDYQKKQVKMHTLNAVRIIDNFKNDYIDKAEQSTAHHALTLDKIFNTVGKQTRRDNDQFSFLTELTDDYISRKPLLNATLYSTTNNRIYSHYRNDKSEHRTNNYVKTVIDSFLAYNEERSSQLVRIQLKEINSEELFYIVFNQQTATYIMISEILSDRKQEVQQEVLKEIQKISFGEDGYIFVNTYTGDALLTNGKLNNTQVNLWNLVDPDNNKVIQMERAAAAKPDGDYIQYSWKKPEGTEPISKISYIKGIDDWEWMLGAGFYLDNVDEVVSKQRKATIKSIIEEVLIVIVVLILLLILIFYFSRYLTKMTKMNFQILNNFFQIAAKEASLINEDMLHFSEFKELASAVNSMIIERKQYEQEKAEFERKSSALAMAVTASHEINQPLMILSGNIELLQLSLRNENLTQKQRQHLEMIYKALARIQSILSMFKESNSVRFENYSDGTDMAILDKSKEQL